MSTKIIMILYRPILGVIIFNMMLIFNISHARQPNESEQERLNRIAEKSDTIFTARVLRENRIKEGLIYESGDVFDIVVIEAEVLKVYRGNIEKNEVIKICTWYGINPEYEYDTLVDSKLLILGIMVDNVVFLPGLYGHISGIPDNELKISRALKLKRKNIDKANVFGLPFDSHSKIKYNLCLESRP
jgi:hypothetical protein